MEQIKNNSYNELTHKTPTHYAIYNEESEETLFPKTANEAIVIADQLGVNRFQVMGLDGQYLQIHKVNNEWKRSDGKGLNDIQTNMDAEKLNGIQSRAELRKSAKTINPDIDNNMAMTDIAEFQSIQHTVAREKAAVLIAENTKNYPNYKTAFHDPNNEYSDTVKQLLDIETSGKNNKAIENNAIESDNLFADTQHKNKTLIPPDIEKQFLRVGNKFHYAKNKDVVAFEDKGNALKTKSDSEYIIESLVSIAKARGWSEIKVSGSDTFRRETWLKATSRGISVKGYTPTELDKALLAKQLSETKENKIENDSKHFRARENETGTAKTDKNKQLAETFTKKSAADAVQEYPELMGAVATVVAIDKQIEQDKLTAKQREIAKTRVRENIGAAIERGELPKMNIKDVQAKRETEEDRGRSR